MGEYVLFRSDHVLNTTRRQQELVDKHHCQRLHHCYMCSACLLLIPALIVHDGFENKFLHLIISSSRQLGFWPSVRTILLHRQNSSTSHLSSTAHDAQRATCFCKHLFNSSITQFLQHYHRSLTNPLSKQAGECQASTTPSPFLMIDPHQLDRMLLNLEPRLGLSPKVMVVICVKRTKSPR